MTDAETLAKRFWSLHTTNNHMVAMWEGDLEHLEEWQDLSPESIEAYRRELTEVAEQAEAVRGDLAERITASTVRAAAMTEAASSEAAAEIQVHNPEIGAVGFVQTFLSRYALPTEEDGRRYLQKLHNAVGFFDQLGDSLRHGAATGLTLVDVHARATIDALDSILGGDVSDDPMTAQPAPRSGVSWDWEKSVRDIVRDEIRPAMGRYREALESVGLAAARPADRPGLCHVPGGDAIYARRLHGYTTLEVSADDVHRRGLEQMERLDDEYRTIGHEAFGVSDLAEIHRRIRTDASLHYHDVDTLIADATEMFERARAEASGFFLVTPESPCEVRPTTTGAMAFYSGPNPATGKPAAFYFNVRDPAAWGPQLAATTFHEGIPGHHFDLARSIENTAILDIHRKMYIAAFNEGWALYSERVADEMGLYRTPVERLGMLMGDSLRAARLVVDTGMHAFGWTRDRAIAYMADNTPLPASEIVPEIDRYIGDPGQACAYMMGRLSIEDARTAAERDLGDSFDVAGFHEAILRNGTVSIDARGWSIGDWVESSR